MNDSKSGARGSERMAHYNASELVSKLRSYATVRCRKTVELKFESAGGFKATLTGRADD
jgi:hypothetical protein